MNRRALLVTTAGLTWTGCVGLDQQPRSRLAWIWLQNDRDEQYDVAVVVEDGGEQVFADTYALGTDSDSANINIDRPVEGQGRYVVRATLDGETREVKTTDYVDGDEDCIGVRFSLLNNGSVDYWTKSMKQC